MYNFNEVPNQVNIRTKFRDVWNHKTTGNAGDIIPIYWKEILPHDEIKINVAALIKMTTPSYQTMDNLWADIHFYYTPNRLLWEHWKEFQGEKSVGPDEVQPEYTIPYTSSPIGGWTENTIADYLGIPTKVTGVQVDSRYFRNYALIWNEWYRDQNRQDFTDFSKGDENTMGSNGSDRKVDPIKGGRCLKAAKIHDYFTSSLLTPTGKERVYLPLGNSAAVLPKNGVNNMVSLANFAPMKFAKQGNGALANNTSYTLTVQTANSTAEQKEAMLQQGTTGTASSSAPMLYPTNLVADLSEATQVTVNQLRMAFQLQKIYEANNRSGSRYIETLRNRWNVIPSDATLQRPEFLGGVRIPLNIDMVLQTSSTNEESPLGQVSGFSHTFNNELTISKGFEEHGILMGFAIIRTQRTYQQGLSKFFSRRTMEDFYMPEFQNLGEVAILNKEIYFSGNTTKDNEVFGYQEYAGEYRSTPNRVTGEFRSNATNSYDNWHYADDYAETPVNGAEWIEENEANVDRTLTVTSAVANQFQFDIDFEEENVRYMPPHSIPGYIDHH